MNEPLLQRAIISIETANNNGILPDINPKEAAKELKEFMKTSAVRKARKVLALKRDFCFIGIRSVTDDPSKLRMYYLGPKGFRKTRPIDLEIAKSDDFQNEFRPDFQNDQHVKRKKVVKAFMGSEGNPQLRMLVKTIERRLEAIASIRLTDPGRFPSIRFQTAVVAA